MKERTLIGIHKGEMLKLGRRDGQDVYVTVWDGMLLLKRNHPDPLVKSFRGRIVAGGRFWREVPAQLVKNPLTLVCFEDTLLSAISWPLRPLLTRRLLRW